MTIVIIGILLFMIVMLFTLRVSLSKSYSKGEEIQNPLIHASGIYSITRCNPREGVSRTKPSEEEIRKYCSDLNEYLNEVEKLECDNIVKQWNASINRNIEAIENGDKSDVEFYYYDFDSFDCTICMEYIKKGQFVTREEIYKHPAIIPPFHIGCTCKLVAHHGKENLRETTELGMRPLFNKGTPPELPDWKMVPKQSTIRGSK